VGVRVDLPLFDRGQGEQAEARAALSSLDEYGDALRLSVRAALTAARARLEGTMAERARFDEATRDAAELLSRAASAGYQGGERSLLELLDARRAALEVAERRLALDLAVRLADVELRRLTGPL
jgi:cobalt-zinc-cadmium efflux system outer membrane protein